MIAPTRMSHRFFAGIALIICVLAVTATLPSRADAWAWKDTCFADVYNGTGDTIRGIVWTPIPPYPSNLPMWAVYVAVGVEPGKYGALTQNTGYPVTWGCSGLLTYATPLGGVSCKYSAPTSGDNSFSCGGPTTLRWQWDDKDLYVHVGVPSKPPGDDPEAPADTDPSPPPNRASTREALRARLDDGDLKGEWVDSQSLDLTAAGPLGSAWMAGTEAKDCPADVRGGSETPGHAGSLLLGDGGAFSASVVADFSSTAAADAVYDSAMSRASIGCLADLLASGAAATGSADARTRISAISRGDVGSESDGYRISIDAGSWSGTLDVLGVRTGDQLSVLLFGSLAAPPSPRLVGPALRAVARRMDGP